MEGSHEDGNYLVRVRAQVMTRDDSTGGWVPMGAGGLSYVSVCKGSVSGEDDKVEYLIYGKRLADQSVVLSCTIKKDFQYNKVMPTFHHWRTGDKKFGLTFQTAADARAFDKGVRMAIEDLSDGVGDFPNFHDSDIGEDDVFMTLELPIDSHSSSGSSSFSGGSFRHPLQNLDPAASPYTHPHANHHHLHRMNFIRSPRFPAGINPSSNNNIGGYVPDPTQRSRHDDAWTKDSSRVPRKDYLVDFDKIEMTGDLNSYVQLSRDKGCRTEHDYSYPVVDSFGKSGSRDTLGSLKKPQNFDVFNCQMAPRLPVKAKKKDSRWRKDTRRNLTVARAQCRHCLEMYSPEDNRPGSCEYGPDAVLKCINKASCIKCAQCMLYHCMSDSEGDFSQHPCSCDMSDGHCPKRWTALAVLSIFVPCLWCYLPFRACHRCGIRCGVCGGKHDPA